MTNDIEVERVRSALLDLCDPLHDAFCWADIMRAERNPELAESTVYGWHATHTVRAYAHLRLCDSKLGAWSLCGNHARNGELWLTDGSYRARILHGLSDKEVPPPGSGPQRRAFYRNPPLADLVQEPLFGPASDRLLLLWRVDPKTHLAAFRVVRPIGDWNWGQRAQTDLDFILPRTAIDLGSLEFIPTDEELELQIPRNEEGAEDAGGLTG